MDRVGVVIIQKVGRGVETIIRPYVVCEISAKDILKWHSSLLHEALLLLIVRGVGSVSISRPARVATEVVLKEWKKCPSIEIDIH